MSSQEIPIGVHAEIVTRRDAILASNRLSPYAVARITGLPVRWEAHVQAKPAVLAPSRRPRSARRLGRIYGLPAIAQAAAQVWGTTLEAMRENRRMGVNAFAVFTACRLAREFSGAHHKEISHFFGRQNGKSAYEWCVRDGQLSKTDVVYIARYAETKRLLTGTLS